MKISLLGAENRPFVSEPSGQGCVIMAKVSSNALRVNFAKPLILCIEDDPVYLTLRKKVLERDGYNVIGVTTGADALEALRESPICAVIADHMLHGTTGTELATEMKKIRPDVPIMLFSGTVPERLKCVDVYVNKGETHCNSSGHRSRSRSAIPFMTPRRGQASDAHSKAPSVRGR